MPPEKVIRQAVASRAATKRFLRKLSALSEGVSLSISARRAIEILDASPITWMARQAGSVRVLDEGPRSCRITSSSPDLLDVARDEILGAMK